MPRKLKLYHEKNLERRRSRKLRELQPEIEEENTESAETPNTEGYSNGGTISQLSMPNGWSSLAATQISSSYLSAPILFYKMQSTHSMQAELNSTPLKITHCLQINPDFTWLLFVQNHLLDTTKCSALKSVPWVANPEIIAELFTKIDSLFVCAGHCDSHFVQMVLSKGKISSSVNDIAALTEDCGCSEARLLKYSFTSNEYISS